MSVRKRLIEVYDRSMFIGGRVFQRLVGLYGVFSKFRHFASKSEDKPYMLFPDPTVDDREQSSAVSRSAR